MTSLVIVTVKVASALALLVVARAAHAPARGLSVRLTHVVAPAARAAGLMSFQRDSQDFLNGYKCRVKGKF